ncbi:MAG: type II secretion system protein [Candidatus Paceibacterota bacterium]
MKKLKWDSVNGFTLIELLVVVAIVGLLASITLGYMGDARKKGDDTAVKTNLSTLRSVAGLFYLENANSYLPIGGSNFGVATCPTYNPSGTNMFSVNKPAADSIAEAVKRGTGSSCANSSLRWAVAIGLKMVPNTSWCVDAEGAAKVVNSLPGSAINSSTFTCN